MFIQTDIYLIILSCCGEMGNMIKLDTITLKWLFKMLVKTIDSLLFNAEILYRFSIEHDNYYSNIAVKDVFYLPNRNH